MSVAPRAGEHAPGRRAICTSASERACLRPMEPREFATTRGEATLRLAAVADIDGLIQLNKRCFPTPEEESVVWNRAQLRNHLRVFPDGQLVVELDGQVVGAIASLIVNLGTDPYRAHT